MQILNIIFTVAATIAYGAMAYFAITAWFELRRLKRDFTGMKRAMTIVTTITMAEHVKSSFNQLNEMKADFRRLVANKIKTFTIMRFRAP